MLCILALALTPYGTRVAAYPLQMAVLQPVNIANISEWQPLSFQSARGKLFLGLVLAFLAVQMLSPVSVRLEEPIFLLFGIYSTSNHRRFLVLFAMALAPLLAAQLSRWWPRYQAARDRYLLNAAGMLLLLVSMIVLFPRSAELEEAVARRFPAKAVHHIREHALPARILNEHSWGGYLLWSFYPNRKVFIDGRTDIYEYAGVFTDYLNITRLAPNTPFLLHKYGIEACLVGRNDPLVTFLEALPDWQLVYRDDLSALYVHKSRQAPAGPTP